MGIYDTDQQISQQPRTAAPIQNNATTTTQPSGSGNELYDKSTQVENNAQDVTVENRLTNLLDKDNPFIAGARAGAQRTAAARGLQNSSIAASAGEKAAIESALPIAQQDAQYYQNRGLNEQQGQIQQGLYQTQGDISSRLQSEAAQQELGRISTQTEASSRLQSEAAQQKMDLETKMGDIEEKLAKTKGQISQELAAQGFEYDRALKQMDNEWNQIDLNARMQVEYDRMAEDNKARFDETVNQINESYLSDYLTILADPNYASSQDRQKAIDVLQQVTKDRLKMAGQISGIILDWGTLPPRY